MATKQEQKARWAREKRERNFEKADKLYGKARRDADMEQGNFLRDPEGDDAPWIERVLGNRNRTRHVKTETQKSRGMEP